jgi:phage-related protein
MGIRLEFYRTRSGVQPALEYILAQVKGHRAKIERALEYLEELGHLARRPHADYLGDEIYELRIGIERHQHRLLYFFHGRSIVVIASGILKNSDRVPQAEVDRARRRRADWLERFGGKA